MSSLLDRIGAFFLVPAGDRDTAPRTDTGSVRPRATPRADGQSPATPRVDGQSTVTPRVDGQSPAPPAGGRSTPLGFAPPSAGGAGAAANAAPRSGAGERPPATVEAGGRFAAVLGTPAQVVPVAAACAGELRARARATAAVLCVWGGGEPPVGATTPAVRRLAARLAAHGLATTASGRLAWVTLDPSPVDAATQVLRARALADGPIVLAVAGPRPAALEPLLAEADLALVVLPADAEAALRALALASLPARASLVVAPLAAGPPRWAAMAGLARMRSLEPVAR